MESINNDIDACATHRAPIAVTKRGRELIVDIHAHFGVPAAEALVRGAMAGPPPALAFTSPATDRVNAAMFAEIGSVLNGVDRRLADMDRLGVDVQAISPSPGQYYYFADPELGRDAARLVNDTIAATVAAQPDRLVGMGTVPLQQVELAVAELKRCVSDLNLRGIEIASNVNGLELADPQFRPFFAAAEELGVLVFLHPLGFTHGNRLSSHYLNNLVGNPLESTVALSHLIFGGVLKDMPGLKLCVAHGGGYLPGYWGRMDHAWRARADCREHIDRPPSTYLRQVWLDTLVFDRAQLDFLVATHGADKLCLGSDYPFDMAEPDPVAFHERLPDDVRRRIVGANAAMLLGLIETERMHDH